MSAIDSSTGATGVSLEAYAAGLTTESTEELLERLERLTLIIHSTPNARVSETLRDQRDLVRAAILGRAS